MTTNNASNKQADLRDKVLTALRWTVIGRFLAQLFRWSATIIVIRFLMPADYGLMSMVEVVFSVLMTVAGAGLADGLINRKGVTRETERAMMGTMLLIAVALATLQWLVAPILAEWFDEPKVIPVMQVLTIGLLLQPWFTIPVAMLKQKMQFRGIAMSELAASMISATTTLILAILGFGIWALVIGQLLNILVTCIGFAIASGYIALPSVPRRGQGLGELLKFGVLVSATSIIWTAYVKVDVFIAGRMLDAVQIGFYAVAMHLASLAMSRLMPLVHQVGFPSYSQLENDVTAAGYYLRKTMRLLALVVCPLFIGLAAVAEPIVLLVLGEEWRSTAPLLTLLCLTMPLRMAMQLYAPGLRALHRADIPLIETIISLLVISATLIVMVKDSPMDIVYAWLIATPLCALVAHLLADRVFKIGLPAILGDLLPPLLVGAVMFAVVYGYVQWVNLPLAVELISATLLGAGLYAGLCWLLLRSRMNEALQLIRKRG